MYLEIFLADFAVFRVFLGISRDFAGPRPHEISEALTRETRNCHLKSIYKKSNRFCFDWTVLVTSVVSGKQLL